MDPDRSLDLVGNWVRVLSLRTRLLRWYDEVKRDLPWRRDPTPYRVVVSELMLQQTRVDVVVPYFERWVERWPDFPALAAASEDDVLAAWSGLGYYRRARALHAIARTVVEDLGGDLPSDPVELRKLPGIGPYTAGAVASIAFGVAAPIVDGNVERVLVRLLCDQSPAGGPRKKRVTEAARRLVTGYPEGAPAHAGPPEDDDLRAADFNQALMELGATVCAVAEPKCLLCPWRRSCIGFRAGLAADLPKRPAKKALRDVTLHCVLVWRGEEFLLVRRPKGTLLSGLWQLPTTEENAPLATLSDQVRDLVGEQAPPLPVEPVASVRHSITNRRITLNVHEIRLASDSRPVPEVAGRVWIRRQDLRDFGASSMTRKAIDALRT